LGRPHQGSQTSAIKKREVWKSLGTSDYAQAKRLLPGVVSEIQREWRRLEVPAPRPPRSDVTDIELRHLVRRWFHERELSAAANFIPPNDEEREERLHACAGTGAGLMQDLDYNTNVQQEMMDAFLAGNGISADLPPAQRARTLRLIQRALVEEARREYDRIRETAEDRPSAS
jgi:hypothetical protein